MTAAVTVIDYRAGNLTSVVKALRSIGAEPEVTSDPAAVVRAERLVLPGVGHFQATQYLRDRGLDEALLDRIGHGCPFLGICVGLQWLFEGSTEAMDIPGLGLLIGLCERFRTAAKVPHVGWNSVEIDPGSRLLRRVENHSYFYFTHSYRAPLHQDTVAVTEYGEPFTAAIELRNVMGVQFHPEKSGEAGLRLLSNFMECRPC